jgi:predicted RNA-binding Zn-ribbon protein involved in translation (DUF1610 family)
MTIESSGDHQSRYLCPVCGFDLLTEPPRSPVTGGGSYEICPSCGFEFGVTDDDAGYSYEQWRDAWIRDGMPWRSAGISEPPSGWDPRRQLERVERGDSPVV